jgi:hypothetical protein
MNKGPTIAGTSDLVFYYIKTCSSDSTLPRQVVCDVPHYLQPLFEIAAYVFFSLSMSCSSGVGELWSGSMPSWTIATLILGPLNHFLPLIAYHERARNMAPPYIKHVQFIVRGVKLAPFTAGKQRAGTIRHHQAHATAPSGFDQRPKFQGPGAKHDQLS